MLMHHIRGFIHTWTQQHGKQKREPTAMLQPFLEPDVLLTTMNRKVLLREMASLLSVSSEDFQSWCFPLINHYAAAVQELPEPRNRLFTQKGGLLNQGLYRTKLAMQFLRNHMVFEKTNPLLSRPQWLWSYVLFSASLLYRMGHMVTDLAVAVYDQHECCACEQWSPLLQPIFPQARYYTVGFKSGGLLSTAQASTLLLARELMPEQPFYEIMQSPELMKTWLGLLSDDRDSSGLLGLLLQKADAALLAEQLNALIEQQKQERFLKSLETDPLLAKEAHLVAAFLEWLKRHSSHASIQWSQEGLLLNDDVLQAFIRGMTHHASMGASSSGATVDQVKAALRRAGLSEIVSRDGIDLSLIKQVEAVIDPETLRADTQAQKWLQHRHAGQSGMLQAIAASGEWVSQPSEPSVNLSIQPDKTPGPFIVS